MRAATAALEEELTRTLKRQTLWKGPLTQVEELPLPSRETVDRFEERFEEVRRTLDKQQEAKAAAEEEIADTQARIQAIDPIGASPHRNRSEKRPGPARQRLGSDPGEPRRPHAARRSHRGSTSPFR